VSKVFIVWGILSDMEYLRIDDTFTYDDRVYGVTSNSYVLNVWVFAPSNCSGSAWNHVNSIDNFGDDELSAARNWVSNHL
jgi:hypothetical protein